MCKQINTLDPREASQLVRENNEIDLENEGVVEMSMKVPLEAIIKWLNITTCNLRKENADLHKEVSSLRQRLWDTEDTCAAQREYIDQMEGPTHPSDGALTNRRKHNKELNDKVASLQTENTKLLKNLLEQTHKSCHACFNEECQYRNPDYSLYLQKLKSNEQTEKKATDGANGET